MITFYTHKYSYSASKLLFPNFREILSSSGFCVQCDRTMANPWFYHIEPNTVMKRVSLENLEIAYFMHLNYIYEYKK